MDDVLFVVGYWLIGVILIAVVYFLFVFLRKRLFEFGKKAARNYMDKIDPDLESLDEKDESKQTEE